MKKHLLIAVLFIAATQVSQAQTPIKAGTVQLGGSIGYSRQSSDGSYTFSDGSGAINLTSQHAVSNYFTINPSAGYFLADNLAVGISAGYTTNKVVFTYGNGGHIKGTSKAGNMYWGAFLQYYRMFTDQFGVSGTLSAGYNHSTQRYATNSINSYGGADNGFVGALTPSLVFFPIPKFSLGASIGSVGYTRTKMEQEAGVNSAPLINSSFGANFGLNSLAFSGTYYFGALVTTYQSITIALAI